MTIDWESLLEAARAVRAHAYAPYSRFQVGAALLAENGQVFAGCNVENRSFGLCICAERSAVATAVSAGQRRFRAVVVVTGCTPPAAPCGMCRETLAEFGGDLPVLLANLEGERQEYRLADLLPRQFLWPENLPENL